MSRTSCPVFRPSSSEFLDFFSFMGKIEREAREFGICKVIPPADWTPAFKDWRGLPVSHPVKQCVSGGRGRFDVVLVEQPSMDIGAFRDLAERRQRQVERELEVSRRRGHRNNVGVERGREEEGGQEGAKEAEQGGEKEEELPERTEEKRPRRKIGNELHEGRAAGGQMMEGKGGIDKEERDVKVEELERLFWRRLGPTMEPPLYGADMEGSLFPDATDRDWDCADHESALQMAWNLRHIPSLLRFLPRRIAGVNTPMLYVGMFASLFAFHTEDTDLFSINYIHTGAPKSWYALKRDDARRFESFASGYFASKAHDCKEYLRHKTSLLSPSLLRNKAGLCINTVVQYPGEFIITMPGAYHAGFNHGFNIAEATNFATSSWLDIGMEAGVCKCDPDSVHIDVEHLKALWNGRSMRPTKRTRSPLSSGINFPMGPLRELKHVKREKKATRKRKDAKRDPQRQSRRKLRNGVRWLFDCACGVQADDTYPENCWPLGKMFQCDLCNVWKHIGCNFPDLTDTAQQHVQVDGHFASDYKPTGQPDENSLPSVSLCEDCRKGQKGQWMFRCLCGEQSSWTKPRKEWPSGVQYQCDHCGVWSHVPCNYVVGEDSTLPTKAFCADCRKRHLDPVDSFTIRNVSWTSPLGRASSSYFFPGRNVLVRQRDGTLQLGICTEDKGDYVRVHFQHRLRSDDEWIDRRSTRFLHMTKTFDLAAPVDLSKGAKCASDGAQGLQCSPKATMPHTNTLLVPAEAEPLGLRSPTTTTSDASESPATPYLLLNEPQTDSGKHLQLDDLRCSEEFST